MKNPRSRAREEVFKLLYQWDVLGQAPAADPDKPPFTERQLKREAMDYAKQLLQAYCQHKTAIDDAIRQGLTNWDFQRVAAIDKNILRIGALELMFVGAIPPKVVINEAIELAKKYSTEKSGAFVNGILDTIRKNNTREATGG